MRLLFLTNLYPPHELGGYEQLCQEVGQRLRRRGHRVTVLTSRFGTDMGAAEIEPDVLRTLHLQANLYRYRPLDFLAKWRLQEQENEQELRRVIALVQPDLALVWGMFGLSRNLPCWLESWMPERVAYYIASYWPQDADIHESYWRLPAERRWSELMKRPVRAWALKQLERQGYPPALRFQHAKCVSKFVRDTLVAADKLSATAGVLYNGIDPGPFLKHSVAHDNLGRHPLRLLYFGSVLPHKGVHTAIEAMGLLEERGFGGQASLDVVGSGHPDYEAQLRQLVHDLRLDDRVRFVDRVPRSEVPSLLGRFDAFLFTSIWPEPMARTVMEAMAAGLLVVGTEVGGQVEMLQSGVTGLTFPAEDSMALANNIVAAIEDPQTMAAVARAGQRAVLERFTLERMVDELETWVGSLAA